MKIDKFNLLLVTDELLELLALRTIKQEEKIELQNVGKSLVLSALTDFIYVKKVKDLKEFTETLSLYKQKKFRTKSKVVFCLNEENIAAEEIKQKDLKVISLIKVNKEVFKICYELVKNEMKFDTDFDNIYSLYKPQLKELTTKDILRTLPYTFLSGELILTEQGNFLEKYIQLYKKIYLYIKVKDTRTKVELLNKLTDLEEPYIFLNNFISKVSRLYIENVDSYMFNKFKEEGKLEKIEILKILVALAKAKEYKHSKNNFIESFIGNL